METDLIVDSITTCASIAEYVFDLINMCFDNEWKRCVLILCKCAGFVLDMTSLYLLATSDFWPMAVYFGIAVAIDRVGILILYFDFCGKVIWNPSNNTHFQRYVTKKTNWRRSNTGLSEQKEAKFKYGLVSLWYGSMFNYTDFAARQWLIDETVVLGGFGLSYIICAFVQGIAIFLYLLTLVIFSTDIGTTTFDRNHSLLALFINLFTVILSGIGVLQHCILIGTSYSTKAHVKMKRNEAIASLKREKSLLVSTDDIGCELDEDQINEKIVANAMRDISDLNDGTLTWEQYVARNNDDDDNCGDRIETCCERLCCCYAILMIIFVVLICESIAEYE
eukprot:67672_1